MTKLEQKLIQLGYEKEEYNGIIYFKYVDRCYLFINSHNLKKYGVECHMMTYTEQRHIDNLQQAYNQLQSDLKELELCQNAVYVDI